MPFPCEMEKEPACLRRRHSRQDPNPLGSAASDLESSSACLARWVTRPSFGGEPAGFRNRLFLLVRGGVPSGMTVALRRSVTYPHGCRELGISCSLNETRGRR